MGSKVHPIRFRLGVTDSQLNTWHSEKNLPNLLTEVKKEGKFAWKKGLKQRNQDLNTALFPTNWNPVKAYEENLYSNIRNWKGTSSLSPTDSNYNKYVQLNLNLLDLIQTRFLTANYYAFHTRIFLKNNQLNITVFIYPKNKKVSNLKDLQSSLTKLIYRYRGYDTQLSLVDRHQLILKQKKLITKRSTRALNYKIVKFFPSDLLKQQWSFELINAVFLLKSASLLSIHIREELVLSKKRHLQSLGFIEKRLISFWNLTQTQKYQTINILSSDQSQQGIRPFTKKLEGIRVQVKGRLNGQDRKRKLFFSVGRLSLQEFDINVDYSYTESYTRYGVLGIKVWIATTS